MCSWYAPVVCVCVCVVCSWRAHGVFTVCAWRVRACSVRVRCVFVVCVCCVRGVFDVCSWCLLVGYVRGVCVVCPWCVHCLFVWCARGVFVVCSLCVGCVQGMCMVCSVRSWLVRCAFVPRAWCFIGLLVMCSWCVLGVFVVCLWCVCSLCSSSWCVLVVCDPSPSAPGHPSSQVNSSVNLSAPHMQHKSISIVVPERSVVLLAVTSLTQRAPYDPNRCLFYRKRHFSP
jgi:hypothetical protein